ncbi:MAG: hypothetical protein SH856_10660 [Flavobacteriales bacterium]|nr:hypothetical protein [Flavobacteriales bacterium]
MFERKTEKIIPKQKFIKRQLRFSLYAFGILAFSLIIGILGYMYTEDLPFLDGLLNASMILTGMGPVDDMSNNSSKLFASLYALYSGVAFLSVIGIFIAPIIHRFMHKVHLED